MWKITLSLGKRVIIVHTRASSSTAAQKRTGSGGEPAQSLTIIMAQAVIVTIILETERERRAIKCIVIYKSYNFDYVMVLLSSLVRRKEKKKLRIKRRKKKRIIIQRVEPGVTFETLYDGYENRQYF